MLARVLHHLQKTSANQLVPANHSPAVFVLNVKTLHSFRRRAPGTPHVLLQICGSSLNQNRDRNDGTPGEKNAAPFRTQKFVAFSIEHIEFQKIMRELIVCNRMTSVEPLAVHHVAAPEEVQQSGRVVTRPTLQQVELPFARSTGERMAPALQNQRSVFIETDAAIRPVQFFLDNQRKAIQRLARNFVEVLIAWLNS